MHVRFDDDDLADGLMERRWFAIDRAAGRLQSECNTLAAVLELVEDAWRGARSRLVELEAIRDALGREMARRHAAPPVCEASLPGNRQDTLKSSASVA
jgi:hypothetical protein